MAATRLLDYERDGKALRSFLNERDGRRLELYEAAIAEGDAVVLVADDGGRAAGWAVLHLAYRDDLEWQPNGESRRFQGGSAAYLESMEVEESRRNRGLGDALLAAIDAEARSRGKRQLWLHTSESNVGAQRFYERHGWRHERTVHPGWHDGTAMRVYAMAL